MSETIVLTRRGCISGSEFRIHLRPLVDGGVLEVLEQPFPEANNVFGILNRCRALLIASSELQAELVVVPDGDRMIVPWTVLALTRRFLLRRVPKASFLMMRAPVSDGRSRGFIPHMQNVAKRVAVGIATKSRSIHRICLLTGDAPTSSGNKSTAAAAVVQCQDPISVRYTALDRHECRKSLRLSDSCNAFLIIGSLTKRKGVLLALEAWSQLGVDDDAVLFLVGTADAELVAALTLPPASRLRMEGRLVVRNEYVDSDLFDRYIAAVDCVILAYTNDGPSGVLGKAQAAGIPTLVAGTEYLQREARGKPGTIFASYSPEGLRQGVRQALSDIETLRCTAQASLHNVRPDAELAFARSLLQLEGAS